MKGFHASRLYAIYLLREPIASRAFLFAEALGDSLVPRFRRCVVPGGCGSAWRERTFKSICRGQT